MFELPRLRRNVVLGLGASLSWLLLPSIAAAYGQEVLDETLPKPTLPWLAIQLVPSPLVAFAEGGARFGLSWQVSPLLYSWAINRRLSGWRYFVVEPNLRHGGSAEVYVSPDLLVGPVASLGARIGIRTYLPLIERGEYLGASFAVGYQHADDHDDTTVELGLYTLYGILGLQLSTTLGPAPVQVMSILRLRYF